MAGAAVAGAAAGAAAEGVVVHTDGRTRPWSGLATRKRRRRRSRGR